MSYNDFIISHLKKCIELNIFEHLILYGKDNSGKSFIINTFLKDYYKKIINYKQYIFDFDLIEDRGIKKIRKNLRDFCLQKSLHRNYFKFIVIPKAEYLNHDSLCALRRIIELYSLNIRFIFLCNTIHLIIPAILSRCMIFRTRRENQLYKNQIIVKNKVSQSNKFMFEYGINSIQYNFIISLCENNKVQSSQNIISKFKKIKFHYKFSNESFLYILYLILRKKKQFNKLTHLSKILYLNYQLLQNSDFVTLNILNILNLIQN